MFEIYVPTRLYFGLGALDQIHTMQLPGKHALVLISQGKSVVKAGYWDRLKQQLEETGVKASLFSAIQANPTTDSVMEAADMARREHCDFVIGFGGGSPMDAAKVVAIMATNPGVVWDYCQRGTGRRLDFFNAPLPIVCISTTAGTGSEADSSGMINNIETKEKFGIGGPSCFPVISVVDPALTLTVPQRQMVYQGLDALFHCVEGYLSKKANLFNEMYAITGVENIGRYLPKLMEHPEDLQAREHVSFANTLGGFVMSTGKLMSQHSFEHVLSAHHPNLPHGAGLILLCRAYFGHFIAKGIQSEKFIALAKALGFATAKKSEDFLVALEALLEKCQVQNLKMEDWGITKEEIPLLAREVKEKFGDLLLNDPEELSLEECERILMQSFVGKAH